jgi:lipid-A-disaccharide synthase
LYRGKGIDAKFVGHPLTQLLQTELLARTAFCQQWKLQESQPIVGVFPGSRKQEIRDLLPVLVQAMRWLLRLKPELQFVISQAHQGIAEEINQQFSRLKIRHLVGKSIILLPAGQSHQLMNNADILWAKSGTTTLEAAIFAKPMLIFYRGNWLSYLLFLLFKTVQRVGWPNLLAGKAIVPELLQLDCRAEQFVRYTSDWLDVPAAREHISAQLQAVRNHLGQGNFATTAASEILATLAHRAKVNETC